MTLRRGFLRLGFGSALLWFVFWTFAYVLKPPLFEGTPTPAVFSLSTAAAILAIVILVAPWIASGFQGRNAQLPDG